MTQPIRTTDPTTTTRKPATNRTRVLAGAGVAALAVGLAACSSDASADPGAVDTADGAAQTTEAAALEITDPWAKAADEGMTAAFGILVNDSDADVRIVSATSDVAGMSELHEMVAGDDGAMVMQQKEGGFVVPAGEGLELAPGGNHVMLMDLQTPVQPGDDVDVVLTAEDGSTFEFVAPARSFSGANEEYHGDDDMEGMESMDGADGGDSENADS
ncbi:copper chaperone PCu(A)C [Cellulosimicrobium arenosum]|uniref:Copper chaperone PCu(A)C n=1 Tax=Cellulosimicrobium arenosum TaxID=2708133 RepID=A0A927J0G8_9MICO|nr:copper chaperone PCu(A)C [Cellulosimicrobium arenosum]MBD8079613.1 copper chaperone PCu(A)C [Cellulosimicrobium arenosum]